MATHDSGSEENPDNFNFENLIIAEKWYQASGKRQNKTELQV